MTANFTPKTNRDPLLNQPQARTSRFPPIECLNYIIQEQNLATHKVHISLWHLNTVVSGWEQRTEEAHQWSWSGICNRMMVSHLSWGCRIVVVGQKIQVSMEWPNVNDSARISSVHVDLAIFLSSVEMFFFFCCCIMQSVVTGAAVSAGPPQTCLAAVTSFSSGGFSGGNAGHWV